MGIYEFLPSNELLTLVGQTLCNDEAITVDICANVLFIIAGFDSAQLNEVNVTYQRSLRSFKSSNTSGRHRRDPCTVGMCGALGIALTIGGKTGLLLVEAQWNSATTHAENIKYFE